MFFLFNYTFTIDLGFCLFFMISTRTVCISCVFCVIRHYTVISAALDRGKNCLLPEFFAAGIFTTLRQRSKSSILRPIYSWK